MAILREPAPWYGTRDNICVYRRKGRDCLRSASTLDGKRVKTSPAFRETMQWAKRLKAASKAASMVYSLLPARRKKFTFYRRLTGQAMQLFKEGKKQREVLAALLVFASLQHRRNKLAGARRPKPMNNLESGRQKHHLLSSLFQITHHRGQHLPASPVSSAFPHSPVYCYVLADG